MIVDSLDNRDCHSLARVCVLSLSQIEHQTRILARCFLLIYISRSTILVARRGAERASVQAPCACITASRSPTVQRASFQVDSRRRSSPTVRSSRYSTRAVIAASWWSWISISIERSRHTKSCGHTGRTAAPRASSSAADSISTSSAYSPQESYAHASSVRGLPRVPAMSGRCFYASSSKGSFPDAPVKKRHETAMRPGTAAYARESCSDVSCPASALTRYVTIVP
jgi:hypothetical protein